MKIARIEAIPLAIPFEHGGKEVRFHGRVWKKLDTLLVRVETDTGIVGWGDAFAYGCRRAVQAALEDMVAPIAVGADARNITGLMYELQQSLHLYGRYGVTIFALSGLEIALWDIAGKDAGLPLHRLLGGAVRKELPAYASLFRYQNSETVAEHCKLALEEGYHYIKLHETAESEVKAAREAIGEDVPLMVDTNCPWSPNEARQQAMRLKDYNLYWLEEPIFPPEDFAALARLQQETGIPLASGENACTVFEFQKMFEAGAVTYAQPSVTKVGGISELLQVANLARVYGVSLMPHSPYFGPGFIATLHLGAVLPEKSLIERFYLRLEASLYGDLIDPVAGIYQVPDGPGLGRDPDPEVIQEFKE